MSADTCLNSTVADCRFVKLSVFGENYAALDDEGRLYSFGMQ